MRFQKPIRNMQDRLRNAGWRIQWISWWEPDKPEYIHSKNPLALLGVAIFLGAIFWNQWSFFGTTLSVNHMIALAVTGLAITMLGILSSALQRQAGWKCLDAHCIDREIGEYARDPGDMTSNWGYRLMCVLSYEGKEYTVTPESSHLVSFTSERRVQKYLDERIQPDGRCRLWINPHNPLQTIFHKKRWWL